MQNLPQKNKGLIIIVVIVVLILIWGVSKYNSFISQNEAINGQWAQVDTQLQRRFDLIPNVVNTVKGISQQEQKVFGEIADARTHYAGAQSIDAKAEAAGQFESALGRLLVITENYPTLLSSQSYRDLTVELEGTENRISVERMKFNDIVRDFNAGIKRFPGSIIANMAGMTTHSYFEVSDTAKQVPAVDFNNK